MKFVQTPSFQYIISSRVCLGVDVDDVGGDVDDGAGVHDDDDDDGDEMILMLLMILLMMLMLEHVDDSWC